MIKSIGRWKFILAQADSRYKIKFTDSRVDPLSVSINTKFKKWKPPSVKTSGVKAAPVQRICRDMIKHCYALFDHLDSSSSSSDTE